MSRTPSTSPKKKKTKKQMVLISGAYFSKLETLATKYYVVEGENPMPLTEVVQSMIEDKYQEYSPPEYKTPGFDRE